LTELITVDIKDM